MATSLRELIVTISADTTGYQREMARAQRMGADYFKTLKQGEPGASAAWQRQTLAARTHASAIKAATTALVSYKAATALLPKMGELITMADEWGSIAERIGLATQSSTDFELAQTRLMEIANRTYRDYNEAASQFAITNGVMREMGFTTRDTLDAAEALGLALVAGGATAQQGASANDAWAKSMARGRIATQELTTIMLQTPRLFKALADGLGKSTLQLQEMAKSGELTANVVVPALISQLSTLGKEADGMAVTVNDAGVRLRNELRKWAGEFNQAHGSTQILVHGIEMLADHLDSIAAAAIVTSLGLLTRKTLELGAATGASALSAIKHALERRNEAAAVHAASIAAANLAGIELKRALAEQKYAVTRQQKLAAIVAVTAARKNETLATQGLAAAQANAARTANLAAVAGRGVLAMMGGPLGLATLVATAAGSWLLFRDNSAQARRALLDLGEPMDAIIDRFRELNRQQRAGLLFQLERDLEQKHQELSSMSAKLASGPIMRAAGLADWRLGNRERARTEMQAAEVYREKIIALADAFKQGKVNADGFSEHLNVLHEELERTNPAAARMVTDSVTRLSDIGTASREVQALAEKITRLHEEAKKTESAPVPIKPRPASGTIVADTAARKTASEAERDAERLLQRYASLSAAQEREIALYGETTRAAALAYDTAHGALAGFSDTQKQALAANAQWLDWLDDMKALDDVYADIAASHAKTSQTHIEKLSAFAEQAARNMQDHFAQFLFNPFQGGLNGMLRGFSDTLRKMATELAASRVFEMLGAALSGSTAGGWMGTVARGVGSALGGSKGGGRAAGGPVAPHTAYEVTEHGPELLTFGGRQVLMMGAQPGLVSPLMSAPGGGAANAGSARISVNIHGAPEGQRASAEAARGADGGLDITVILKQIDGYIASGIAGGYGSTQAALKSRFALREAV